jgi:hypothetical protein
MQRWPARVARRACLINWPAYLFGALRTLEDLGFPLIVTSAFWFETTAIL